MDENISSGFCNGKFSLILICKSALMIQSQEIGAKPPDWYDMSFLYL
jgi:hypothetical protein